MDPASAAQGMVYVKSIPGGMFTYTIIDEAGMITAQNVGSYEDILRLVGYNHGRIRLMLNK
jgi:hypothetical protein